VTGKTRRHHLHETALQRAVKAAALRIGIAKPVGCHTLRSHRDLKAWITRAVEFALSLPPK
jgi:hypothetical protein